MVLFAPGDTKGCTHQPKSTAPPQLPVLSCCSCDAPEPEAGCTKPFSWPHPPLGLWKTHPSPGAPEDAGLGCDEDLGCRALQTLLCGWIICAAAPALLQEPSLPGRWEVWQILLWGAERCWELRAGQGELEL